MKTKTLTIKMTRQPDTNSCGVSCVHAVLNYYGHDVKYRDLRAALNCDSFGGGLLSKPVAAFTAQFFGDETVSALCGTLPGSVERVMAEYGVFAHALDLRRSGRRLRIRKELAHGPVLLLLDLAHWVVAAGYMGTDIVVVDPADGRTRLLDGSEHVTMALTFKDSRQSRARRLWNVAASVCTGRG